MSGNDYLIVKYFFVFPLEGTLFPISGFLFPGVSKMVFMVHFVSSSTRCVPVSRFFPTLSMLLSSLDVIAYQF